MDRREELTLARGMGKIEGLVSVMATNMTEHIAKDDGRFDHIIEQLGELTQRRFEDAQAVIMAERNAWQKRYDERELAYEKDRIAQEAIADRKRERTQWKTGMVVTGVLGVMTVAVNVALKLVVG